VKTLLIASLSLAAVPAFAETRTYDLSDFSEIEISDGVGATVIVGKEFLVEAEARRGNLDRLNVDKYGDRLSISRKGSWGLFGFGKSDRFEVTITLPELVDVESTSGSSVHISGETGSLVSARSSSGSTLTISDADLERIELQASSGSTLNASGTCSHVDAQSNSGSTLLASTLECETAKLESSSGSSLGAFASVSAGVDASSGASLRLRGGAEITEQSVSSGASLSTN